MAAVSDSSFDDTADIFVVPGSVTEGDAVLVEGVGDDAWAFRAHGEDELDDGLFVWDVCEGVSLFAAAGFLAW